MSSLAERVQRVAVKEVPGTREQAEEGQAVLEDFAVQHGSTYDFRGEVGPASCELRVEMRM